MTLSQLENVINSAAFYPILQAETFAWTHPLLEKDLPVERCVPYVKWAEIPACDDE